MDFWSAATLSIHLFERFVIISAAITSMAK